MQPHKINDVVEEFNVGIVVFPSLHSGDLFPVLRVVRKMVLHFHADLFTFGLPRLDRLIKPFDVTFRFDSDLI